MIGTKCPGQDMRYWTSDDVYDEKCPKCGEMIEFFKTDIRLRCPNCKTRVANPRFNMGCAEWCAYAEQCLGPGARGLKTQSLKTMLLEQVERRANGMPLEKEKIKNLIVEAESICQSEKIDMFPVFASIVALSLKNIGLIDDPDQFIDEISSDNSLPQAAVKDTRKLVVNINEKQGEGPQEKIVADLLKRIDTDI
ncbi:MAG: hypothetical protein ACNA7Z_03880 [Dethiobacteria bacterium]